MILVMVTMDQETSIQHKANLIMHYDVMIWI